MWNNLSADFFWTVPMASLLDLHLHMEVKVENLNWLTTAYHSGHS